MPIFETYTNRTRTSHIACELTQCHSLLIHQNYGKNADVCVFVYICITLHELTTIHDQTNYMPKQIWYSGDGILQRHVRFH